MGLGFVCLRGGFGADILTTVGHTIGVTSVVDSLDWFCGLRMSEMKKLHNEDNSL